MISDTAIVSGQCCKMVAVRLGSYEDVPKKTFMFAVKISTYFTSLCCYICEGSHVMVCNRFIHFSQGRRGFFWSQSQLSLGEGVHPGQVASSSQGPR